MEGLAVPLLPSQLEAANIIHRRLEQWSTTDRALALLAERLPGFAREETLLKVAAINQLYGTNVFAVVRMAEHVTGLLASGLRKDVGLVEEIGALPLKQGQLSQRKHVSFASKFCHFFVHPECFPIYDNYAVMTVVHHLGRHHLIVNADHPYRAFVANLGLLRERAHLTCSTRELDRYLWLAGLYRTWTARPNAKINTEAVALFASPPEDVATELRRLGASN